MVVALEMPNIVRFQFSSDFSRNVKWQMIDSKSGQYVISFKKIMKILELPTHSMHICITQQRQSSRCVWTIYIFSPFVQRAAYALCTNEIKMNKSLNKCVKYAQRLMNLQLGNYCWFIRAPFVQKQTCLCTSFVFFRLALSVRVHI